MEISQGEGNAVGHQQQLGVLEKRRAPAEPDEVGPASAPAPERPSLGPVGAGRHVARQHVELEVSRCRSGGIRLASGFSLRQFRATCRSAACSSNGHGFALDDGDRVARDTRPNTPPARRSRRRKLVLALPSRIWMAPLRAGRDAQPAAVALLFVDLDDFSFGHDSCSG